jgi:hypothetical protein
MHFRCDQKTYCWRAIIKFHHHPQGSTTLLAAFLVIILSTLGLGMIFLSQVYARLAAYKKNSVRLDYAAENGLKDGWTGLSNQLQATSSPLRLSDASYQIYRSDSVDLGTKIIEDLLSVGDLPLDFNGQTQDQMWQGSVSFSLHKIKLFDHYFSADYHADIAVQGRIGNFPGRREAHIEALLNLHAGRLPLPLIPVLVNKNLEHTPVEDFLAENHIHMERTEPTPLLPPAPITAEDLIPQHATELIQEALNIEIFRPQDLTPGTLRKAIGLEPSPEPVPPGVYLMRDDLGLGGIYVQGDLSRMILAIDLDYQVIAFWQDDSCWVLRYNPSDSQTRFTSPQGEETFNLSPRGIIIVDGNVESLGSGIVNNPGDPILPTDQEIPCILRGIDLTIICSDRITITSHLIHQGVQWQDGVPYVKDGESQLHILATGTDIWGEDGGAGEIVIGSEAPDELKLQASLTAAKQGISFTGNGRTADLLGSLHFSEYDSQDNTLRVHMDTRLIANEAFIRNAPLSRYPILTFTGIRPMAWKSRTE